MGMVGGGKHAFIGAIHRFAANIDGLIKLHCGAFSSNSETSKESGKELLLAETKCYDSYHEMFATESGLSKEDRMDFVTIVTPNLAHLTCHDGFGIWFPCCIG